MYALTFGGKPRGSQMDSPQVPIPLLCSQEEGPLAKEPALSGELATVPARP